MALREFPLLKVFSAWDCRLETLEFLQGAALEKLYIERSEVDFLAGWQHLGQVQEIDRMEQPMAEADRLARAGDFDGAQDALAALLDKLTREPWFDSDWRASLSRRTRRWADWKALGLGPWLREGAAGPPPGSVEWRGRWFYFLPGEMTRAEAEQYAAQWGGYLATLADPEEEALVRAAVVPPEPPDLRAHLGAWRPSAAGPWHWHTGEPWTACAGIFARS